MRSWLATAPLPPDGRLPAERQLSATLGVSRSELRKALAVMEIEGTLTRQVGRGTYLATLEEGSQIAHDPAMGVVSIAHVAARTSPHEAMTARMTLEPELASLAAIHATPMQLIQIADLARAMRNVESWAEYETLDAEFHSLIARAAKNELLYEMHRVMNAVRLNVVWAKLKQPTDRPPADYHSFDEHDAVVAALQRHDRAAAHAAMRAHLRVVLAAMSVDDTHETS